MSEKSPPKDPNSKPFLQGKKKFFALLILVGCGIAQAFGVPMPPWVYAGCISYILGEGSKDVVNILKSSK